MTRRKYYLDSKIVQVLAYLVAKLEGVDLTMLPLLKLIYFADRYHLRKYGRFVTGDDYFAMQKGPVASESKSVIEDIERGEGIGASVLGIKRKASVKHRPFVLMREITLDELSESDIEALDVVIEKYGRVPPGRLSFIAHQFPEWINAKRFLSSTTRCHQMCIWDFFLNPKQRKYEYCEVPDSHVQLSKKILMSA